MSEQKEFKKSLGLTDATMIVAGSMIGSGIFIVSSKMAQDVGSASWLMLLWVITGIITISAALSYAELAAMMPQAGGQFVYLNRIYGKAISFVYGWTVLTVIQTGVIAAVAVAFANFSSVFFPLLKNEIFSIDFGSLGIYTMTFAQLYAAGSVVILTFINAKGVQNGKLIQLVFTLSKLMALLLLIILGLAYGLQNDTLSNNFSSGFEATRTFNEGGEWKTESLTGFALIAMLCTTIIYSLFSSDAWNNVTYIAGEIKEPHKNLPRSLVLGTIIVTGLYLLANLAYLALLPVNGGPASKEVFTRGIQFAEEGRVGTSAAFMIFGDYANYIMAGLIMVSTFGCNNGVILAGGRLYYSMAKEGLFIRKAGVLNKNQVPGFALWLQCIWACVLCLSGSYMMLVMFATFASMFFYIFSITGLFILRKREPDAPRPYKAFGYPFVPAFYILCALIVCITLGFTDTFNTLCSLGLIAIGFPVYYGVYGKMKHCVISLGIIALLSLLVWLGYYFTH